MLYISHDLSLVRRICDRIAVMYAGRIAEIGTPRRRSSTAPRHPYTRGLLARRPVRGACARKARGDRGHGAGAGRSAARLPLRRPLPARGGDVLQARSAARGRSRGDHAVACFIHHRPPGAAGERGRASRSGHDERGARLTPSAPPATRAGRATSSACAASRSISRSGKARCSASSGMCGRSTA